MKTDGLNYMLGMPKSDLAVWDLLKFFTGVRKIPALGFSKKIAVYYSFK